MMSSFSRFEAFFFSVAGATSISVITAVLNCHSSNMFLLTGQIPVFSNPFTPMAASTKIRFIEYVCNLKFSYDSHRM